MAGLADEQGRRHQKASMPFATPPLRVVNRMPAKADRFAERAR
jgi:hypothetical protein